MWKPNINLLNLAIDSAGIKWNNTELKFFELSNHLGNVMSVINDDRVGSTGDYTPVVINAQDYYAFGSVMPGREYALNNSPYRYGFNGKENDNEVKGTGNQQDYGMRIYDPRVGKFLSVDPLSKEYPELTPYQFAGNTPIQAIDLDGTEPANPEKGKKNLLIVVQGYVRPGPIKMETQVQNAMKRNAALGADNDLGQLGSSLSSRYKDLQTVTFASSNTDNTRNDIAKTINAFKKANPEGKIIAVGHSLGGENIIQAAAENSKVAINLMITLDPRGTGLFRSSTINDVGKNVDNSINYWQYMRNGVSGAELNFNNNSKGINIEVEGTTQRAEILT
jgi:RHS repeat-associated protein